MQNLTLQRHHTSALLLCSTLEREKNEKKCFDLSRLYRNPWHRFIVACSYLDVLDFVNCAKLSFSYIHINILMSIETEIKLYIAPEDTEKFVQHPLLQSANHSQHLYNTYFDTPKHDLLQHGVALRVRRIGDRRVQTMKTAGTSLGGLHKRQEWENDITGDTPDYAQFPTDALPKWCADKKNLKKIKAIFTTDFNRTTWLLALEDGSKIEVALDQGKIKTQAAKLPLSEVEFELKSGSPEQLYKIALTLQDVIPLLIENKSKAERGYALDKPKPLTYQKAGAVKLSPDMTAEQAFVHIIWHCLEHLQANEDMVLYGEDIEGVHQMRVALRRLRSGLSWYKPLIPNKKHAIIRDELKWITNILGVARDWDVFALSLQEMQSCDKKFPLKDLRTNVAHLQARAYVTVRETLRSPRYSRMLLLLGKWLTQRRWRRKLDVKMLQELDNPVKDFASQTLEKHHQRVCQRGENFAQLSQVQLHELRIFIKKMAYGSRFFAALYPQKLARPYAKSLSHLQDELGILNDGNVATDLLNQAGLGENAPARHFLNGWYAHQEVTHLAHLEKVWQAFLEQKIFW
jgi:inorganic triphosphatase YgiF